MPERPRSSTCGRCYRSGAIAYSGLCVDANSQSTSSSSWCWAAHSMVRPRALEGSCPSQDLQASDRDLDLELPVHRVEVRRVVIVEVHSDDDPKEATDLRHRCTVRICPYLRLNSVGGRGPAATMPGPYTGPGAAGVAYPERARVLARRPRSNQPVSSTRQRCFRQAR